MASTSLPVEPPSASAPEESRHESQQQASSKTPEQQDPQTASDSSLSGEQTSTVRELRQLLESRDQEIRKLRYELEKYKLALHQSQLDYHYMQRSPEARPQHSLMPAGQVEALLQAANDSDGAAEPEPAADDILVVEAPGSAELGSSRCSPRVVFRAGAATSEDEEEEPDDEPSRDPADEEELGELIQDVGDIELGLDFQRDGKRRQAAEAPELSSATDEDEDVISDGLLTSLTDAAISNLSQLAALQERCESQQQQHSHQYQQQSHRHHLESSPSPQQPAAPNYAHDPFSAGSHLASQAALAISAAANTSLQQASPLVVHPAPPPPQQRQPSVSLSHNSTIQQADLSASNSLASVVAAAAAAAAAAASSEHLSQSRLISSALPSPELYHNLQQQQVGPLNQRSPVSSLRFSPSTSVTPSPSSLLAGSRRSNTSSSLLSPIASPSYLRRQFLPDRLPLMSPSPTSGLGTCSSSGASSSLAQMLHQQRSASALAGSLAAASSSSTPISSTGSTAISPLMSNKNSSQARLNNMQIRHKFGYLGSGRAQFNSPHGFCLGLNQEIVVADTNNHRVCIFDKSGTYITQFGSPGKEEGQLWNPRKVAILHRSSATSASASCPAPNNSSNTSSSTAANTSLQPSHLHHHQQHLNQAASSLSPSTSTPSALACSSAQQAGGSGANNAPSSNSEPIYVVCDRGAERSRMQLFTKDGAFIKKIGIHYIDIVAGLAITQNGLIIVVDSVSPTVYIINGETGILNGWFDCSGYMKEPSDIAVKSDVPGNEYFICDFKGHCVVVFSEQGEYLRKIGHDGLTSYPNGIDISDDGDILVGDSHGNRFHVVVFDRNGNFVSQFECPHVKVSRCCGLKITREGYIVTLAKNNHHVLVLDTIHI